MAVDPSFLSGVVEGFYGQPWSQGERFELFECMHSWGLNTYLYAPKDDLKHRALWRELYSTEELQAFRELIRRAAQRGIRFIYALAPGLDVRYANSADADTIKHRFNQMLSIGCADFALLFDDIPDAMQPEDQRWFKSFADAQVQLANDTFRWTRSRSPQGRFLFCPTPYCGRMAQRALGGANYLETVGRDLLAEIDVLWTGPEIISKTIAPDDLPQALGRKPILWDNLHANDYDRSRFYCGPYAGRDPEILPRVHGILSNPNCEFALNFVPLRTFAKFLQTETRWDARSAFQEALAEWESHFRTLREEIRFEHLQAFADCYYLPHEDGSSANDFYAAALACVSNSNEHALKTFREGASRLREFCQRATELRDRKLFSALAQRIWDLREEIDLLEKFVAFRADPKNAQQPFHSDFHLPKTYRGGFIRRLQSILAPRADGSFAPTK